MNASMNEWMNECMDEWMDEWMHGWMNGWTHTHTHARAHKLSTFARADFTWARAIVESWRTSSKITTWTTTNHCDVTYCIKCQFDCIIVYRLHNWVSKTWPFVVTVNRIVYTGSLHWESTLGNYTGSLQMGVYGCRATDFESDRPLPCLEGL